MPYSNQTVAESLLGLAEPFRATLSWVMLEAAKVVTVGAVMGV